MRRARLVTAALVCVIGCRDRPQGDASEHAPAAAKASEGDAAGDELAAEIPADRRCGEAGATATTLPPDLVTGMIPVGEVTLRRGERAELGTISLHYDAQAWVGTRSSGHRGEALAVEIDRAEANGGPWGARRQIAAGREQRLHVGPYRFDLRMSAAPVEVHVEVTKTACPDHFVIERTELPLSLWVSTEALRSQTFDLQGAMLTVVLTANGAVPRLEVKTLGWAHWFEPRPGAPMRVRAGDRIVSIDEVIPGPGTSFAGGWSTDGIARVHARARIEAAPPRPVEPRTAGTGCGTVSSGPTRLPPSLAVVAPMVDDLHIEVGASASIGGIELSLDREDTTELSHGRGESMDTLRLELGAAEPVQPSMLVFSHVGAPAQFARLGATLLRVDASKENQLHVRGLQLACADAIEIPTLTAPTYLWLSTIGHARATVGPRASPTLSLQLHADAAQPVLTASSEHAYLSQPLRPAEFGDAFTLDGASVEIVDIQSTDATHEGHRWETAHTIPAVHVQLRIAPE